MKLFLASLFVGALSLSFPADAGPVQAGTEKVIYFFCTQDSCSDGSTDGVFPQAGLVAKNGKLYGTAALGGGKGNCGYGGCGTVFSIDPDTGTETVLYAFQNAPDGANPSSGVSFIGGTVYGTTMYGGRGPCSFGCGTIFSLDPATGREKVLHAFERFKAEYPGGLINVKGTLFGTTEWGGKAYNDECDEGCGTVFFFDLASGKEAVIHRFRYLTDGGEPMAKLLKLGSSLYGTTTIGGTYYSGTVFSLDLATGQMKTVYNFGTDDSPSSFNNLIDVNGMLYGTTYGTRQYCDPTCGTIFSLDPKTGTETVLHVFCGQSCSDGAYPAGGLINVGGILYGTTNSGGTADCHNISGIIGCGTVYSFDLNTSAYSVVYSFQGKRSKDGSQPNGSLLDVNGALYGTTATGGKGCNSAGCGTVFAITP